MLARRRARPSRRSSSFRPVWHARHACDLRCKLGAPRHDQLRRKLLPLQRSLWARDSAASHAASHPAARMIRCSEAQGIITVWYNLRSFAPGRPVPVPIISSRANRVLHQAGLAAAGGLQAMQACTLECSRLEGTCEREAVRPGLSRAPPADRSPRPAAAGTPPAPWKHPSACPPPRCPPLRSRSRSPRARCLRASRAAAAQQQPCCRRLRQPRR